MRSKAKKILSLLLTLTMVLSMMPVSAFATGEEKTYEKITSMEDLTTGKYVMVVNSGYAPTTLDGNWILSETAAAVEDAFVDPAANLVWTITVDGSAAKLTDSNGVSVAPKSGNNNGIQSGDYSWAVTCTDGVFRFAGQGSDTTVLASNKGSDNKFRAYKTSTVSGNANGYPSEFSLYKLTDAADPEPDPEPEKPVFTAPFANGDQVVIYAPAYNKALSATKSGNYNVGVDVTVTEGVMSGYGETEIWTVIANDDGTYSFDNGGQNIGMADEYSSMNLGAAHDKWELTDLGEGLYNVRNTGRGNYMEWYARYSNWSTYNSGSAATDDQFQLSFYLVPAADPEPSTTDFVLTDGIADGDKVVMYNAGSGTLVSSTASGYKLTGVAAAPTDAVITTEDADVVWTVSRDAASGSYTFTQDNMVLGMVQSGSYVNLSTNAGDGNTEWVLEAGTAANVFYLKNANMPAGNYGPYYLEYYNGYTAYASNSPSDAAFGISFYKLGGTPPAQPEPDPEPDPEPEVTYIDRMTALPADGDTIVIYNSGNAMGSAASGKKLAGVAAEVTGNKLPLSDDMAQLLVTVDEDGSYILTMDGKYLTSAATGNGLSFADELTDCGKWTMAEAVDSTWYIKNVGANYNGNYNQAIEFYSGFTTYGIKETEIYQMQLFLVAAAKGESGKITSADELVDGTYVMVVSGGYAPLVLDGSWVTVAQPTISGDEVTDAKGAVWTLDVEGSTVTLTDSNGASIKPKGGNSNGIASGSYAWSWSFDESSATFVFAGTGSDTVKLASNASEDAQYGGFHKFRGYKNTTISGNPQTYPCNFTLYKVDDAGSTPESNLPAAGDEVVVYNLSAEGVLASENDTQSINNASAEIVDGKAVPANGGVVFTVSRSGDYYRFFNETYGYLCSNGTGNNAFYSLEASEDADWTLLEGKKSGYNLESRTAKFNGKYSQYLEYYADSYKTYSMYNVSDYDIYEFMFYPVAEDLALTGGIVNMPTVTFDAPDANKGTDYTFNLTVDAVFGIDGDLTVMVNQEEVSANSDGTYTVPAEKVIGTELDIVVSGVDTKGVAIYGSVVVAVMDEPGIADVCPAAGSQTGEDKRPVISAELINIGENAVVTMVVNGEEADAVIADGKITYTPAADLPAGRTTVTVTVVRADGKSVTKSWSFTVGEAAFQLYFGQLHSHTTYSDGSGSLESALDYIGNLPDSARIDFVAFTDHSNYFDKSGAANPEEALYDMSQAAAGSADLWNAYKNAIASFNAKQSDVIALGGFEMTWSGGPGHINTFNTPGIVSRNNTTLNNKTADAGMKAYYALLSRNEGADSISQFNHPGSTFGTFSDFACWDAVIDSRFYLVEVGNGEGQIGAGGYFPSYDYYTMALDKGWHVAPTNNQDNHKGKWGNANDARNVILTDDFSEEGIYQAIRDLRVYSTEDKNLEIGYTVNGMLLGSILEEVPEKLALEVTVYDPDRNDSISRVEVIVNSGKVAYTWSDPSELAGGVLTAELDPTYSYYYIRVTEGDGDLAVTAPVWVGENLKLGISSVVCGTSTPVTGEELTITTTLFNSESTAATVKSLTYTCGDEVLGIDPTGYSMPASGTLAVDFGYTPDKAKLMDITVTAVVELEGEEYTFSMDVELDVQDADKLVYIGIDASHYNEYVSGNYKDSMGNFGNLAAEYGVRTVQLNTSDDLIAACANEKYVALILTAPSRRSAEAQAADPLKVYTAEELAAITTFHANGGTVILAGWSDHYENYPDVLSIANMKAEEHMAATQNAVLEALGSSLRIGDDATYDDTYNGGQAYRLYFNTYGESFLTEGVEVDPENPHDRLYTEVFSHYGGASIYTTDGTLPAAVTPVVFGHSGTYSVDVDKDGLGGDSMPRYAYAEGDERLMIMASEQLEGKGLIIVSGAAFMSNFEVQATIEDSGSEKNYSNYKICENLLRYINPVAITDIADVQAEEDEGVKFTIEGIVTSNASGYDKDTAFFDCIYLQDDTAGINAFPVAGSYKIGDKVRITGTTSSYQGERQIAVTDIELIEEGCSVEAKDITAAELNDGSVLGSLVILSGTVVSFELANGLVQTILVEDENGDIGRIFIDGYITTDKDVEGLAVGCSVTATGLASYDNTFNAPEGPFPRIRIRDRADIVCSAAPETPDEPDEPDEPEAPPAPVVRPSKPAGSDEPAVPALPFSDVVAEDWFFEHVLYVYENGIMEGVGGSKFAPDSTLTRGMIVTILYRLENEPDAAFRNVFSDVAAGEWYSEAVEWAAANGIVNGYGEGVFGVNDAVTRQQLAAILFRYAIFKGMVSVTTEENLQGYADDSAIAAYAISAMNWAVGAGILVDTDNMLLPAQNATRAEIAMAIHLYLEN